MVFRHYRQHDFVLRYPCCETFIDQGFCITCLGKGEVVFDDKRSGGGDGKLFPYLLYVGDYIPHEFLREMPVCHINVAEAKRIMSTLINQQEFVFYIEVWDTEGKCHVLRFCRGERAEIFYYRLFYYVSSSVSTCALQVPLSNLNLAEQYLWAIQNRAIEILEIFWAMSSVTANGCKRKKDDARWDKQMLQLLPSIYDIQRSVNNALYYIDKVDWKLLKCIENALK